SQGGVGVGTFFKITPQGAKKTLYSFYIDGGQSSPNLYSAMSPLAPVIQGLNGDFYGTSLAGGKNLGTVYEIYPYGLVPDTYNVQVIWSLGANDSFGGFDGSRFDSLLDGLRPTTGLTQDIAGNLYSTTINGGVYGEGTVFMLSPSFTQTMLWNFGNVT